MAEVLAPMDADAQFFARYPARQCHIRKPRFNEKTDEFLSLGFHQPDRRRIIAWKVPKGSAFGEGRIVQIPFLAFADETIEDGDAVLLPILHEIMVNAAKEHGMSVPKLGGQRVN